MRTRHALTAAAIAAFIGFAPAGPAFADRREPPSPPSRGSVAVPEAAPRLLELVNRERAGAGLAALGPADDAAGIALDWSGRMAAAGGLSHNDDYLSEASMKRLRAVLVGENVAFAQEIDEIHEMLMNSPPHRRNILNPDFRLVGFGAVRTADGDLYVTEDFLTREASAGEQPPAAKNPEPAPAARPRSRATSKRRASTAPKPESSRPRNRPGNPAAASRPASVRAPRAAPAPAPVAATPPPLPATAASEPVPEPAPAAPPSDAAGMTHAGAGESQPAAAAPGETSPTPAPQAVVAGGESQTDTGAAPLAVQPAAGTRPSPSPIESGDLVKGLGVMGLVRVLTRRRRP